ncbi:hypothetical protein O6P43_011831 [Quillaja saponaria]|uniref:Uncharacterized protein n=1 Tax=Quillaja saponaria TaxID=32244 RepID=A0AAD7PUT3_QUISA|nr:hypothetical protein O6P43_011831 [Quillaja saponaria]
MANSKLVKVNCRYSIALDIELAKMRTMTTQEIAAAAERVVAAAIAETQEVEKDVDVALAAAEEAEAFMNCSIGDTERKGTQMIIRS